jgi:four helix bundle protein
MAKVEHFEDLGIWQLAREICNDIWSIILTTPLERNYKLKDQIDSASGSIMDNIAEGFERNGNKEFLQFLSVAKASCGEVRSQLYRCLDRNYLNQEQFELIKDKVESESKQISAFMRYLRNSEFKGSKYN